MNHSNSWQAPSEKVGETPWGIFVEALNWAQSFRVMISMIFKSFFCNTRDLIPDNRTGVAYNFSIRMHIIGFAVWFLAAPICKTPASALLWAVKRSKIVGRFPSGRTVLSQHDQHLQRRVFCAHLWKLGYIRNHNYPRMRRKLVAYFFQGKVPPSTFGRISMSIQEGSTMHRYHYLWAEYRLLAQFQKQ